MLLMKIIGMIGAIVFLILPRKKNPQDPFSKAKEAWLVEHTDPLFGRPNDSPDVMYFERDRTSSDRKIVFNEYQVPFRFSKTGFVNVFTDEFPLHDQKFIFEWMVERMEEVSVETYRVLWNSTDYETFSEEELSTAFNPGRITRIKLYGSGPVVWSIHFDTDIGVGEALVGTVRGQDQRVESAEVGYG